MAIRQYTTDIMLDGDLSQSTVSSNILQITGDPNWPVNMAKGWSLQAVWSDGSSLNGTLKIQVSLDATNWVDITNSTISINGTSGNFLWNIDSPYYKYAKVLYTKVAGSGFMDIKALLIGYSN